jgi:hypothetical protein
MRRIMPGHAPRPTAFSLKTADFGRGWAGLLLIAAGLGAAGLAPQDPAAGLISCLPTRGPAGIRVVLEGDGLESTRGVRFGAQEAAFMVLSGQRVETHVPPGAASAPITLLGAAGVYTTGTAFLVTPGRPGPPAIAQFWPASGPVGNELSVTGSGLASVEEVRVAGRPAEFSILSDTDLVLYVPADQAASGPLTLNSPFGTAVSAQPFVLTAQDTY